MGSRRSISRGSLAALLALALAALPACSSPDPGAGPDAGWTEEDAGTEPRDAGVERDAGAGADAGEQDAGPVEVRIKHVVPSRGPVEGGTAITIEGGGFYRGFASGSTAAKPDTRIYFGGNEAGDFRIIDDDTLEVTAPPNRAGPADVLVRNPNGTATCAGCFTYYAELALTGLSPGTGPLEGGAEIALTGDGFGDELVVLFGGRASPQVVVVDANHARAVAPPAAAAGAVDVRAFNKNGSAELRRAFVYEASLALEAVEPPYAPIAGGATVHVRGAALAGVDAVLFGAEAAAFTVIDAQTLEVTVPAALAAGPVAVEVRAGTASATLPRGFVYVDPAAPGLALVGLWPTHGPAEGGGRVVLVGSGFEAATEVLFGAASAGAPVVLDGFAAEVQVPAGVANGAVDVVVRRGADEARLEDGYHYNLRLDALSPAAGSARGGERVVIEGAGFSAGLEVLFGALAATEVTLVDAGTLEVTTPPGAGGASDVRVREAADPRNEDRLEGGYTFVDPLTVGRIAPDVGAIAGGTYVTAQGTGFEPGVIVEIGGTPLKDVQVVDGYTLVGRTPPGEVGAADVVARIGEARDETPGGFTYFDPTLAGGGSSGGPLNGTLNVTVISATEPLPGATVMLGNDPTTPLQGRTDRRGQLTFSDPQLVKAQQVTVFKDGYLTVTIARQESRNLTVFLSSTGGGGSGAGPGGGVGSAPAVISGRVTGFKLPRPLVSGESAYAEVWVASSSLYSTPPTGYLATPEVRDARGERWQVSRDGGTYSVFAAKGLRAVYAVFGILEHRTGKWTPYLMGVRRAITADPDRPAMDRDILLDMHLDATVPITIESSPMIEGLNVPARNETYAWLELGGEGVIPLGKVTADEPELSFTRLPRLDGGNLIFLNRSSDFGQAPESFCFRKQLGDLSGGVDIGPMLGLVRVTAPAAGEAFAGEIGWSLGYGPPADLAQLTLNRLTMTGYETLWQAIVPGTESAITLPGNVRAYLEATGAPGDRLFYSLLAVRAPRFEYHHWSYSHLSLDAWTSWTSGSGEL